MTQSTRWIVRRAAGLIGASALLQTGTCNVQFPPDNTECNPNFGICIARPKALAGPAERMGEPDMFTAADTITAEAPD